MRREIDLAFAGERSTVRGTTCKRGLIGCGVAGDELRGNSMALQPDSLWRFAMWAASLRTIRSDCIAQLLKLCRAN